MRYIGIDPGIIESAVVVLSDRKPQPVVLFEHAVHDRIGSRPGVRRLEPRRLAAMVRGVYDVILDDPVVIAIEEPFVGANGATALKTYAVFAGLLTLLEGQTEIKELLTVSPQTIKKFVGAKQKVMVAREVYRKWGYSSDDHNLCDAYAIARWALERGRA